VKPVPSDERADRYRRRVQDGLLFLAIVFIVLGFAVLAVPPETPMYLAIDRTFLGVGLLLLGFLMGLLSRIS
jgi:hypothetical protein